MPHSRQVLHSKGNIAFTLIELLVVVAIIGVLAAMLLPALKNAKAASQSSVCVNNLRQIHLAFRVYADENNDTVPPVSYGPNAYWHHYLGQAGYLGSAETFGSQSYVRWKVLRCPGEQAPTQSGVTKPYWDYDYNGCSYSVNWTLSGYQYTHGRRHFSTAPNFDSSNPWGAPTFRYAQSAADASFVMDCQDVSTASVPNWFHDELDMDNNWNWTGNSWSGYYHAFRHPGQRANMLYVDGHVASVRYFNDGGIANWKYLFNYDP